MTDQNTHQATQTGEQGKAGKGPQADVKPDNGQKAPPANPKTSKLKVVPLPTLDASSDQPKRAQSWAQRNWKLVSALIVVGLPTLLTAIYVLAFATDRYAVESQFAVRSQDSTFIDASGILGALGGAPDQTSTDSHMVVDYLQSVDFIDNLQAFLDIEAIYGRSNIDFISRLTGSTEIERLADYWSRVTNVYYDNIKGTIILETSAFTPDESVAVAERTLQLAGELVNRISLEARNESLRNANADLARAELRLAQSREAMREFRAREQIADPVIRAGSAQQLIATLEGDLARVDAEIASAGNFLSESAPGMIVLQARRESILGQIDAARRQIDGSTPLEGGDVARILSSFEELGIEQEFAQQAYTAALTSLEAARAEADRNQRYLAVFVQPRAPERAEYPRAEVVIPTVFAFSLLAWVIGVLGFYGIREHAV
ncbi:MAG: hypothetical protein AAF739_10880 [Pseudomonadota bacterium]